MKMMLKNLRESRFLHTILAISMATIGFQSLASSGDIAFADGKPKSWNQKAKGSGVQYGVSETIIDAPIEVVEAILEDHKDYKKFIPNCVKSRALGGNKKKSRLYLEVELLGNLNLWAQIAVRKTVKSDTQIEYVGSQEQGSFERFDARFQLRKLKDGKTKLRVMMLFGLDMPIPDSVLSNENKAAARDTVHAVKKLAQRKAKR